MLEFRIEFCATAYEWQFVVCPFLQLVPFSVCAYTVCVGLLQACCTCGHGCLPVTNPLTSSLRKKLLECKIQNENNLYYANVKLLRLASY